MPKKKAINEQLLIRMVQEGLAAKEMMIRLGLKTSTQLKVAYANALMNAGMVPVLRTANRKDRIPRIKVNKRGSLVIPRKVVEDLEIGEEDRFEVSESKAGLSLAKLPPRPVTVLRKRNAES